MKIAVVGASGQTGRLTVERAVAGGNRVNAIARRPEKVGVNHPLVSTTQADATDPESIRAALAGDEAVISCLGAPGYTKEEVTIYSEGTGNVISAMKDLGIRRLVCVGTTGVTLESPPDETWLYRKLVVPALFRMGRTGYEDNARMERIVRDSGLAATIVRAGGLFDPEGQATTYEVRDPLKTGRFTARTDLADALVRFAQDDADGVTTVGVFTTTGTPKLRDVLIREALGRSKS